MKLLDALVDADRVQQIRHFAGQNDLLVIDYTWTINNWVETRTETDYTVQPSTTAVVSFDYDDRGRLTDETRVVDGTTTVYDLSYTYDQLGNRETKFDAVTQLETRYTYDVELEQGEMQYPTRNNRLLYYELYDMSQTPEKLLRTVTYTYWDTGEASNITIKDEDPTGGNDPAYDWHNDLALYYEGGRHTLRLGLWDRWKTQDPGDPSSPPDPETYKMAHAREFRYEWAIGGPRERYLTVDYDPSASNDPNGWTAIEPVRLTDYLGPYPYADADVTSDGGWSVAQSVRYLFSGAQETVGTGETQYYHGDLVGSTMLTTDEVGSVGVPPAVTYTAFGEILDASGSPGGDPPAGFPRYQYVGAWGYETAGFDDDPGGPTGNSHLLALYGVNPDLPRITLQHVGFRWYDPSLGRFVQRDPIGLLGGGVNVYAYVENEPLSQVDPDGLWSFWPNTGIFRYGPSRVGFGKSGQGIYRLAFRVGTSVHIYGAGGAAIYVGSVCVAFGVGYGVGTGINHLPRAFGKKKLSDYLGDIGYRGWRRLFGGPPRLKFGPPGSGGMIAY